MINQGELLPIGVSNVECEQGAYRLGKARQFALAVTARRYEIEQMTNDLGFDARQSRSHLPQQPRVFASASSAITRMKSKPRLLNTP